MDIDLNKTIKNWKWWIVLPIVLPWFLVAMIPHGIIFTLEFAVCIVERVNFGAKPSRLAKRIVDWVQS